MNEYCRRISTLAEQLRDLIADEWMHNRRDLPLETFERDLRFIERAENAGRTCSSLAAQHLLEEMRGLSHYFGSYCSSPRTRDALIDEMFEASKEALIASREEESRQ